MSTLHLFWAKTTAVHVFYCWILLYSGPKIPNCLFYKTSGDVCEQCNFEYYFNGTACASMSTLFVPRIESNIENCWQYTHNANECDKCDHGYYLSGKICKSMSTQFVPHVEGTIKNCWMYERNANQCSSCKDGHYPSGKTCASIDSILFPIEKRYEWLRAVKHDSKNV